MADTNSTVGSSLGTSTQDDMMTKMNAITQQQEKQAVAMAELDARSKLADGLAKRIKSSADSVKSAA
jgi:hypothetical protein